MAWYASRLWISNGGKSTARIKAFNREAREEAREEVPTKSVETLALKCNLHSLLQSIAHRPWPLSAGPWIMRQTWHDLLFAHWPLPPATLAASGPSHNWNSIIFDGAVLGRRGAISHERHSCTRSTGVARRIALSRVERSHVCDSQRQARGIFLQLDAANRPAVWAARRFYHLPYFHAEMSSEDRGRSRFMYSSRRISRPRSFEGTYRPTQ